MRKLIKNIGLLVGIAPEGVLKKAGKEMAETGMLENAWLLIEDGRIDQFVADRYASYRTGIGAKIRSGETSLQELAAYAESLGAPALPGSGRQEYLESVVNQILFS